MKEPEQCKYCKTEHESHNFYESPYIKERLMLLKKKYDSLPADEQQYRMENYAVRRGLRRNATAVNNQGQKKPEGGTVVMCGYGKLVEADIWLRKLEEQDGKIVANMENPNPANLPF